MNYFVCFSDHYANGVTAVAAIGALLLAAITLWYLKREFESKYRPYVFPMVHVERVPEKLGCVVSIGPRNIGPHPCHVKFSKIRLHIGDETYETPDSKEWILLAPQGLHMQMPAGTVNEIGVTYIREGRYKNNRIELEFILHTSSVEGQFKEQHAFAFEINVIGETPQALFRPEWRTDV